MNTTARIATLAVFLVSSAGGAARLSGTSTAQSIDFEGFLEISREVARIRPDRLLPLDEFLSRAAEPETLLLDTRSARAFAAKHLAGAVHLNLSDLTEESLTRIIGERDRLVLIYCNNNFSDGREPFLTKKPAAALNIPTFVSLWTYGFENVYELGELLEQSDPRLAFEGELVGVAR